MPMSLNKRVARSLYKSEAGYITSLSKNPWMSSSNPKPSYSLTHSFLQFVLLHCTLFSKHFLRIHQKMFMPDALRRCKRRMDIDPTSSQVDWLVHGAQCFWILCWDQTWIKFFSASTRFLTDVTAVIARAGENFLRPPHSYFYYRNCNTFSVTFGYRQLHLVSRNVLTQKSFH